LRTIGSRNSSFDGAAIVLYKWQIILVERIQVQSTIQLIIVSLGYGYTKPLVAWQAKQQLNDRRCTQHTCHWTLERVTYGGDFCIPYFHPKENSKIPASKTEKQPQIFLDSGSDDRRFLLPLHDRRKMASWIGCLSQKTLWRCFT
jgi:hypothetical protein